MRSIKWQAAAVRSVPSPLAVATFFRRSSYLQTGSNWGILQREAMSTWTRTLMHVSVGRQRLRGRRKLPSSSPKLLCQMAGRRS